LDQSFTLRFSYFFSLGPDSRCPSSLLWLTYFIIFLFIEGFALGFPPYNFCRFLRPNSIKSPLLLSQLFRVTGYGPPPPWASRNLVASLLASISLVVHLDFSSIFFSCLLFPISPCLVVVYALTSTGTLQRQKNPPFTLCEVP